MRRRQTQAVPAITDAKIKNFHDMDYIELNVPVADQMQAEIVTAMLADLPFESFAEDKGVLKAYIPKDALCDCKAEADALLAGLGIEGVTYIEIETQNWNALWESNFEPVEVDGACTIRAPFSPAPAAGLDVVIMPKMSFGTGHHATTWLMTAELMKRDLTGLRGLDMGSGTGVLSIVAVKRGAACVDAVDIDEWAFENCGENIAANGVAEAVHPILGDVSAIADRSYDFILANINRNILLADMPAYCRALNGGGELLMSGILERDVPAVTGRAAELGLDTTGTRLRDGWAVVACRKA